MIRLGRRQRLLLGLTAAALVLLLLAVVGTWMTKRALHTDFTRMNLPPSLSYPFGTDWMGRDMLARTLAGLSVSMRIGLLTAVVSAGIALLLGCCAAFMGRAADAALSWLIDLVMGVPHMLLLVLIAFACGRGFMGVVLGITMTHWMQLARVIRGEVLQLRGSGYVLVAEKLGLSRVHILKKHLLPHLLPQFVTGLVLLFPHAILHEASITFLGFGLPPEQPAIGIILSESMRYLSMGRWWLAVFPGVLLVTTVLLFDFAGRCLRGLSGPHSTRMQ